MLVYKEVYESKLDKQIDSFKQDKISSPKILNYEERDIIDIKINNYTFI